MFISKVKVPVTKGRKFSTNTGDVAVFQQAKPIKKTLNIGKGGRSSVSGVVCTVFGSTGFVGRYVTSRLGQSGSQVVLPYRGEEVNIRDLKIMGDLGQIVPLNIDIRDQKQVDLAVSQSNVVVNLLGKFWPTRNFSLKESNFDSAVNIAQACKRAGIERVIHLSAIKCSTDSPSEWARWKAHAEAAVQEIVPTSTILRTAPVAGIEDRLLNRYGFSIRPRYLFCWNYENPELLVQPIAAADLASAVASAVYDPLSSGKVYEIGGSTIFTRGDLWDLAEESIIKEKIRIDVPEQWKERFMKAMDFRRKPKWHWEEYQWYNQDLVCDPKAYSLNDLRIVPLEIDELAPTIFRKFRSRKAQVMLGAFNA